MTSIFCGAAKKNRLRILRTARGIMNGSAWLRWPSVCNQADEFELEIPWAESHAVNCFAVTWLPASKGLKVVSRIHRNCAGECNAGTGKDWCQPSDCWCMIASEPPHDLGAC